MSVASLSQLGFKKEVTYDTPVLVDRFFEFEKESIVGSYMRIESKALRAGTQLQRADRWAPNPKGAAGTVDLEVLSKGYGFWLEHMLGTVATGTINSDGFYTHTATFGALNGKSFCAQVGRPDNQFTVYPSVYSGGKVAAWTISNSVDALLMLSLDLDFAHEFLSGDSGSGAAGTLATATYPTATELMSHQGASFKIAGTELAVKDVTFKGTNTQDADRYFIRANGDKKEQLRTDVREYTWEATIEFEGLVQLQRVVSATAAGAVAAITCQWQSPTLVGATHANLLVSAAAARWDSPLPNVDGATLLTHKIGGKLLDSGSGSPVTIAYQTTDATP